MQPLVYAVELLGRSFFVRDVTGTEAISTPFRFELGFHVPAGVPPEMVEPDDVIGKAATLVLLREGAVRRIEGVVTQASIGATRKGAPKVELVLEPRLALARKRVDVRLFRTKTAPEIVVEVLSGLGINTELRLSGTYEKREYTVQMRESDFAFVSRLLEDEGIFYFFLPKGDVMVLGDHDQAYEPLRLLLPFRGTSAADQNRDGILSVGWRKRVTPGKVTLRDFNPDHPSLDMDVSAEGPWKQGPEWYDYPGEYMEPDEGHRKARLRAEALLVAHAAILGEASAGALMPGGTFELFDAPPGLDEGEHVVTSLKHAWSKDKEGFKLGFEAIAGDRVFRPFPSTEAPRILNPVTGFVTGPAGEDIHTDPSGRVKVHMHWDRQFPHDDTCSFWIPTLQDNTGHSVGIPRIGWEVMLHFLEGDPDRPVVLGRVYNPTDTFPEHLPELKTRSALRSVTSPRAEGGATTGVNQIRFDDQAGSQTVFVHAQKDQNVVVANDKREEIQNSETRVVTANETISIGNDHTLNVKADIMPRIDGDQTWTVSGSRTVNVAAPQMENVIGNYSLSIGGMHFRKMSQTNRVGVNGNLSETVGGVIVELSRTTNMMTADVAAAVTVGGAVIEIAKVNKSDQSNGARVETVGGIVFSKAGETMATRVEKTRITSVGFAYKVKAAKELVLAGETKLTMSSMTGTHTADKITLKVGSTEVKLADGLVSITADEEVKLHADALNKTATKTSDQA